MTQDEMIAVITARKEGKTIECKYKLRDSEWKEVPIPRWNFIDYDYRIKPEAHYRPFKSAEEVMEAIKEHGYYAKWDGDGKAYIIGVVCDDYIEPYNDVTYTLSEAFESYTFADGTPFGKLEE